MPNPTPGDVHVNVPLTNMSIAYLQDLKGFVADSAAPNIPVQKQSDRYYVYNRDDFNRDTVQPRAPSSESAGGGWTVDNTPSYFATKWALHKDIDDDIRANADQPINMDRDATNYLTLQMALRKEKIWESKFFRTGIWTTELAGVTGVPGAGQFKRWDVAGSDPIGDVDNARIEMHVATGGFKPNKMALSPFAWKALKNNASIIERIKYTQRGVVSLDLLASLFELDEIVTPWGVENAAKKGVAEANQLIMGKHALLYYTPPEAGLMVPSAMYTFSWTGLLGAGAMGNRIKSFRIEKLNSDRVEIEGCFDMKLTGADLGVMFLNAVS